MKKLLLITCLFSNFNSFAQIEIDTFYASSYNVAPNEIFTLTCKIGYHKPFISATDSVYLPPIPALLNPFNWNPDSLTSFSIPHFDSLFSINYHIGASTKIELLISTGTSGEFARDTIDVNVSYTEVNIINQNDLKIYPNPSTGIFHISEIKGDVFVYNTIGVLICKTSKSEVDISNYPTGIYYAKINDSVYPIIKQ